MSTSTPRNASLPTSASPRRSGRPAVVDHSVLHASVASVRRAMHLRDQMVGAEGRGAPRDRRSPEDGESEGAPCANGDV
jgi:hypothetical protein